MSQDRFLSGVAQNPVVRQAVQGGLAVGLSILFGSMLSGRRWYWAAISAFIVAIGVGSRSEALTKALQRVGGTLLGIAVGIALATLVAGHTDIAWVLIMACVFGAFYAFQLAYGAMVFFITVLLALLYGLLGQFQPELLLLRLEETAVGGTIGVLVTTFVLPMHDDDAIRDAADEFLCALADVVRRAGSGDEDRTAAVREMQLKAQALRSAIGPVKRGWAALSPPRHRLAARTATYCAFLARELSEQERVSGADKHAVLDQIESLRAQLDNAGTTPPGPAEPEEGPAAALCQALRRFAQRLEEV